MPWNKAPPAPVPLRLRDPNAVAEQQKDVTAWDFKDWISGCSLQYGIFGSFFWKLIRKCRRHKEKKRKISAVFEVDKWSFSVECEAEICGWFFGSRSSSEAATPLGRHGTYDEVRDFGKNMGLLGFSRFIPLFIQILGHHDVMMWFIGLKSGFLTGPVASHQGGYRNSQPVISLASWDLPCCFWPSQLSSD